MAAGQNPVAGGFWKVQEGKVRDREPHAGGPLASRTLSTPAPVELLYFGRRLLHATNAEKRHV